MNQSDTVKLISVIKSQYQHKFITDAMTAITWMELLNAEPSIPYDAARQAALVWMQNNDWPPSVKDLRDIVASTVVGIPDADAAWTHLTKWLKAGYPGMPDNRPRLPVLIRETVTELGGSSMFYNAEAKDDMRGKFTRLYERKRREQVATTSVTEAWEARGEIGPGGRVAIEGKVA
jgi:DNA-binding NtrC family response regulator